MQEILTKASKIKLIIFDIDGVLTDGTLWFDADGHEYKKFHARDGHGIKLLSKAGIEVAVISGRGGKSVEQRMHGLGVKHVFLEQADKREAFILLSDQLQLIPEQIAYVGDDVIDLPVLRRAGLAIAVQDAHPAILPYVDWQTSLPGGAGAVREVTDLLLQAQNVWQQILTPYLD